MKGLFFYFVLLIFINSCVPSRYVDTLEKGEQVVSANLGGPLIDYSGLTIPVPLTSLSYAYGLDSNITAFGGLHATSLLFNNLQIDAGAVFKLMEQDKYIPSVSVSPVVNIVKDFDYTSFNFWPQLDVNAFWKHRKNNNYFYLGASNWFELSKYRAHEQEQIQRWLFNPHFGYVLKTKKNWNYGLEFKFLAPNKSNENLFVPYQSFTGNTGATGVYLTFSKRF